MYKINMVCRACKREIDDRSFTKTKIITIEHFDKGPWIKFNDMDGTKAKTDDRFSICQQCYKKYFKFLIEEDPENEDEKHKTYDELMAENLKFIREQ